MASSEDEDDLLAQLEAELGSDIEEEDSTVPQELQPKQPTSSLTDEDFFSLQVSFNCSSLAAAHTILNANTDSVSRAQEQAFRFRRARKEIPKPCLCLAPSSSLIPLFPLISLSYLSDFP